MIRLFLYSVLLFVSLYCSNNKLAKENENKNANTVQINLKDSIVNRDNKKINPDQYDVFVSFPGGQDSLKKFIYSNLIIPEDFKKSNKEGKVFLDIKIDETGKVIHSTIIKSLTPSTDKEALRIINLLPNFIPAQRNGENVISYLSFFIKFDSKAKK